MESREQPQEAPSLRSRTHYGGDYHNQEKVNGILRRANMAKVKKIRKYLDKLVESQVAAGYEQSPRVDAKRLVKHLVSKRGQIQRCFKEELERAQVIFGSDISGSCSAVCDTTTAACLSLAMDDDRAWVVAHSNGEIRWMFHQSTGYRTHKDPILARAVQNPERWGRHVRRRCHWWLHMMNDYAVKAVVAFGDHDAEEVYKIVAEGGADLYWLHSQDEQDKEFGVTRKPNPMPLEFWPIGWSRDPVAFWRGVKDVDDTLFAFRKITQEMRAEWKTRNDQWRTGTRRGWKTGCGRDYDMNA
jgi:hypothetical protein